MSNVEFPRSYLRALIAEDDAARDNAAARAPRVVELDTRVASVTGIDEARARLHPPEPPPTLDLSGLDEAWRGLAACRGIPAELFYPPSGGREALAQARSVCEGCEVRVECLDWAVDNDERHGVWGGMSERQRRRLRRTRRSGAA